MKGKFGKFIVAAVAAVTFNKVRGQALDRPSLRWWWTPWTSYFGAGGWIFLSPGWLWGKFRDERDRRVRVSGRASESRLPR